MRASYRTAVACSGARYLGRARRGTRGSVNKAQALPKGVSVMANMSIEDLLLSMLIAACWECSPHPGAVAMSVRLLWLLDAPARLGYSGD